MRLLIPALLLPLTLTACQSQPRQEGAAILVPSQDNGRDTDDSDTLSDQTFNTLSENTEKQEELDEQLASHTEALTSLERDDSDDKSEGINIIRRMKNIFLEKTRLHQATSMAFQRLAERNTADAKAVEAQISITTNEDRINSLRGLRNAILRDVTLDTFMAKYFENLAQFYQGQAEKMNKQLKKF